jgi:hypothetical protein
MDYNKYTKKLQNKIKKLNLNYEDTGGLLVCLYLYGGCSEEDCAKLFEFTLDSVIDYLKYEQIYGYKICSCCEKLKERNAIQFKKRDRLKTTNICTECKKMKMKKYDQEHSDQRKEYFKEYRIKNKDRIQEYNKEYNKEHSEQTKEYNKEYEEENKEILKEKRKTYNLQNKEKRKTYNLKNKEKIKEYMKEYNLKNKETKKEYMKAHQNSPTNEELVQKLKLYEEVKGNQIKCRYCGDWYTPTVQEVENRLKGISKSDIMYIYCSEECKEACPVYRKVLYPKGFKKASSREVNPVLRQLVFERDQYTCQKCLLHKNELDCSLHCHHINPYVDSPIEGNDPENCITLCKDCHKEVHKIPGCGYNELKCG